MLSESATKELRAEVARLKGMRDAIDHKIKCIHDLLAPDIVHKEPSSESLNGRGNQQTFAQRVREALASVSPAKARDVATIVAKGELGGKSESDITAIVSTELYRMAERETGGVYRVARGVYDIRHEG